MLRKFLKLRYAAIRRYGERKWTAADGVIEFNPQYTVGVSSCEVGITGDTSDYPYIVELSNGTKFLAFLHDFGDAAEDEILSEQGEEANQRVSEFTYVEAIKNIHLLNNY